MTKIVQANAPSVAVEVQEVSKAFGSVRAIDGLSLEIPAGTVYGLLGPNGAGKTTLVRVCSTLLRPDSGNVLVFGQDVIRDASKVRSKIALTGQFASVDEDLTGSENLVVLARLLGYRGRSARDRAHQLLDAFDLADAGGRLVKSFSGGMRRRLDLAASLVVKPQLLFLDEPTTGLDPRSRNQVWDVVRELAWEGTTVLLTTQYLEEADRLAQRIAVVDHGRLVAEGTSSELKALVGQRMLRVRVGDPDLIRQAEHALTRVLDAPVELSSDVSTLSVRLPSAVSSREEAGQIAAVLAELSEADISVRELGIEQPSLDEVFLALTGGSDPNNDSPEVAY